MEYRFYALIVSIGTLSFCHGMDDADLKRALAFSQQEYAAQPSGQAQLERVEREEMELARALSLSLNVQSASHAKKGIKLPKSMELPITVLHPLVVQQKGTECGFMANIFANIYRQTFASIKDQAITYEEALEHAQKLACNEKMIVAGKKIAEGWLTQYALIQKLIPTADYIKEISVLSYTHVADLLHEFYEVPHGQYTIVANQLPFTIADFSKPAFKQDRHVIQAIHAIKITPYATHTFLLRADRAHKGAFMGYSMGHWIAIVAHNAGDKIYFVALDSQYPVERSLRGISDPQMKQAFQTENELNVQTREIHDKMWQALLSLFKAKQ